MPNKTLLTTLTDLWITSHKGGYLTACKKIEDIVSKKFTPESQKVFRDNIEKVKGESRK